MRTPGWVRSNARPILRKASESDAAAKTVSVRGSAEAGTADVEATIERRRDDRIRFIGTSPPRPAPSRPSRLAPRAQDAGIAHLHLDDAGGVPSKNRGETPTRIHPEHVSDEAAAEDDGVSAPPPANRGDDGARVAGLGMAFEKGSERRGAHIGPRGERDDDGAPRFAEESHPSLERAGEALGPAGDRHDRGVETRPPERRGLRLIRDDDDPADAGETVNRGT
jgi:hypothetical protein